MVGVESQSRAIASQASRSHDTLPGGLPLVRQLAKQSVGSTRAVVEGSTVVESYDYDPYGLIKKMQQDALDQLWGSTITAIGMSLARKSIEITVVIPSEIQKRILVIECTGVRRVVLDNSDSETWDYTELTGIHADANSAGGVEVFVELWSGAGELTIVCDSIGVSSKP